jgi:hypothetical protein
MVFLHIYEYRTLNSVEVILRGGRGMMEDNGRDEPNLGMCTHTWKCHSKTPVQLLHTNKNDTNSDRT